MPAFAADPPTLNDSEEPGSVIVFPKFIKGTFTLPAEGGMMHFTDEKIQIARSIDRATSEILGA